MAVFVLTIPRGPPLTPETFHTPQNHRLKHWKSIKMTAGENMSRYNPPKKALYLYTHIWQMDQLDLFSLSKLKKSSSPGSLRSCFCSFFAKQTKNTGDTHFFPVNLDLLEVVAQKKKKKHIFPDGGEKHGDDFTMGRIRKKSPSKQLHISPNDVKILLTIATFYLSYPVIWGFWGSLAHHLVGKIHHPGSKSLPPYQRDSYSPFEPLWFHPPKKSLKRPPILFFVRDSGASDIASFLFSVQKKTVALVFSFSVFLDETTNMVN